MRFFTYIFFIAFFLECMSVEARPKDNPFSGDYLTQNRGYCQITVPSENEGMLVTTKEVCLNGVPVIFAQLGLDVDAPSFIPIQVVVMKSPRDMQHFAPEGTQLPSWSGAVAFPSRNLVLLPTLGRDGSPIEELEVTLAHEISHIAFYRAAGEANTPRWFSEGVAIIQSEGSSFHRKKSIWWASLFDHIEPLESISDYPEGARSAEQAYAQAADFVAFLLKREGWNSVRFVLSELRTGSSFPDAFYHAYGTSITRMETIWKKQLFGSLGWVMTVTGDAMWLGVGALICIVGFFMVRSRKRQRLREMEEEEAQLEKAIAAIDQLIVEKPAVAFSSTPVMDRLKKQRIKIEVDGKFHTLH